MKSQPASERYSHFYQTLYDSVEEMNEMPEYDRQLCFEYFETVILPKSTLIETAGNTPGHQYFIISGHLRKLGLQRRRDNDRYL